MPYSSAAMRWKWNCASPMAPAERSKRAAEMGRNFMHFDRVDLDHNYNPKNILRR